MPASILRADGHIATCDNCMYQGSPTWRRVPPLLLPKTVNRMRNKLSSYTIDLVAARSFWADGSLWSGTFIVLDFEWRRGDMTRFTECGFAEVICDHGVRQSEEGHFIVQEELQSSINPWVPQVCVNAVIQVYQLSATRDHIVLGSPRYFRRRSSANCCSVESKEP